VARAIVLLAAQLATRL